MDGVDIHTGTQFTATNPNVIRGFRQLDATFGILESIQKANSRWWFQTFCGFHPENWGNDPI